MTSTSNFDKRFWPLCRDGSVFHRANRGQIAAVSGIMLARPASDPSRPSYTVHGRLIRKTTVRKFRGRRRCMCDLSLEPERENAFRLEGIITVASELRMQGDTPRT